MAGQSQGEVFLWLILLWTELCIDILWFKGTVFLHIPRILETSLFPACWVNTRINTFLPGRQLPKMLYDKYFHITNFYICRYSTQKVFLKSYKIHNKTPVPELLFNQVTGLYEAPLLKEKTPIQMFSDEFCKILNPLGAIPTKCSNTR